MKHKHAEMIKAKADNMDLAVLLKTFNNDWVEFKASSLLIFHESDEYFLCLPKHQEAVLHALNGGDAQFVELGHSWRDCGTENWSFKGWYMDDSLVSRIKPRKETRWAVYDNGAMGHSTFETKEQLQEYYGIGNYQPVSFEVEV